MCYRKMQVLKVPVLSASMIIANDVQGGILSRASVPGGYVRVKLVWMLNFRIAKGSIRCE
jgi:hypothetical protein